MKKELTGKRILIVDDEKDVLESLIELLDICKIDTASTFEDGKQLLETRNYDIAILDIMGVNGFELLEIAKKQKIPALMLTANSLTEKSLEKSFQDGAAYFAPKDRMQDIDLFITDVLDALDAKKSSWDKWLTRLGGYYDKRFQGTDWRDQEKKFWEKKMSTKY
jgi:CheY-like chemotaxis protein